MLRGLVGHLIPKGVVVLQYVDDPILCLEHNLAYARHVKLLLYVFEQLSGLKINFDKSDILMIGGDLEIAISYAEVFNYQIGILPLKYLGVPISIGRLHIIDWNRLEEKQAKKLEVWQGNSLSSGGRAILINTSPFPIQLYTICPCFYCPRQ
jgi:hypothetical protein